jgi:hypothetical protein
LLLTALLLLCVSCLHAPKPIDSPDRVLYLTLHVPADRPFVEELEYAREVFEVHGVRLEIADIRLLERVPVADEEWRTSINEVYRGYDGTLHIFFVEECLDSELDADGQLKDLRGIAWHRPGTQDFAAVAKDAPITTFSHEIGHVLDLDHLVEDDPMNIMCNCSRVPGAGFTDTQGMKMRVP